MITVFLNGKIYGQYSGWMEIHAANLPVEIWDKAIALDTRFSGIPTIGYRWTHMSQQITTPSPELRAWELLL